MFRIPHESLQQVLRVTRIDMGVLQALMKGEDLRVRSSGTTVQLGAHRLQVLELCLRRQIRGIGDIIGGAGKGVKHHDV